MSKRKTFGLGYHRLSRSTKWRRCFAENSTSWHSSSSSNDEAEGEFIVNTSPTPLRPNDVSSAGSFGQPPNDESSVSSFDQWEGMAASFSSSCDSLSSANDDVDADLDNDLPRPTSSADFLTNNSDPVTSSMAQFLQTWAVDHNVPLSSMDALLKGLRTHPCFKSLPSCGRTILQTPSNLKKHAVDPGFYVHLGLKDQLLSLISSVSISVTKVKLLANVDGLPPFKSSQGELYPILVSVLNITQLKGKVIPVGLYYGTEKPRSVSEFLMPFIKELNELISSGIKLGDVDIEISLAGVCCDAPAKSFIMGIIGHGGFYSCTKCTIKGATVEHKRVFLQTDCPKRTHDDFMRTADIHFRCRDTPLVLIQNINFVDSFVLDYMHLVCLGVVRTLLLTWTSGTKSLKTSRISKSYRDVLSDRLDSLSSKIPCEFSRKTRNLSVLLRWKATEFRLFLLYVGPVVLKGILDSHRYINFLELHIAMSILLNPNLCKTSEARENARKLLIHFVQSIAVLYGEQLVTHNFHGLVHLVDDADNFVNECEGFSLNDISAFQFENYLQTLKRLIRGKSKPLEQVSKRLSEKFAKVNQEIMMKQQSPTYPYFPPNSLHNNGPLLALCSAPQYSCLVFKDFKITSSISDSFVGLSNGDIVKVSNFAFSTERKQMVAIGKKFKTKTDFYADPLVPSSHLGIYLVEKMSSWRFWPISHIKNKYVSLPYKNGFVVFPLLHTFS